MAKKKQEIDATSPEVVTKEYEKTVADLKAQIQGAQIKAVISANKELLKLYWSIGKTISERRSKNGWGNNIVEKLAKDLQNAFPGIKGFSRTNFFRMQAFYGAYEKVPRPVGQIGDLPIFSMMKYKGYFGDVKYDSDVKIFHGEVIGLKDVITFQAKTVDELEKAFKDSINEKIFKNVFGIVNVKDQTSHSSFL